MTLECIIIDDSFFVRETLSAMIVKEGHVVTHKFGSGMEFLDSIESISADIIFLDIILPNLSGLEVLSKIREISHHVKIIMLSGMTQGNTISEALRLGATDFVSKPISDAQLSELLRKFSIDDIAPSVEELSNIGIGCLIISNFLAELRAHSSATLREEINNQSRSILDQCQKNNTDMFLLDLENITIKPNPNLWGLYSEEEVFSKIKSIPKDLKLELFFIYPEKYITTLFDQTMLTLISRNKNIELFNNVDPEKVGLKKPKTIDIDRSLETEIYSGSSHEELERALSISAYYSGSMGPMVATHINSLLIDENDTLKNIIFYSTLIMNSENYQEGLFGPLPVSVKSDFPLGALVYTFKIVSYEDKIERIVLLTMYFTPSAEKIISDSNKLSFLIKARISTINWIEEIDRLFVRNLLDEIIDFILD
ncbi:MAG: response regulator [Candidatus Heimdallarchaeota archaeon]|nr:response regulator [Candidatus Heimdallarchaeota archaeon]